MFKLTCKNLRTGLVYTDYFDDVNECRIWHDNITVHCTDVVCLSARP